MLGFALSCSAESVSRRAGHPDGREDGRRELAAATPHQIRSFCLPTVPGGLSRWLGTWVRTSSSSLLYLSHDCANNNSYSTCHMQTMRVQHI